MSTGFLATLLSRLTPTRATNLDNLNVAVDTRVSADIYTAERAAKLDKLDDSISSRASGLTYTDTRAAKLDSLDANISTRAASTEIPHRYSLDYSTPGTHTWTQPSGVYEVYIILVGAGGRGHEYDSGSGYASGGGGGAVVAGRFRVYSDLTITLGDGTATDYNHAKDSTITGVGLSVVAESGKDGGASSDGIGGGGSSCYCAKGGDGQKACPGFAPAGTTKVPYHGGGGSYGPGGNGDQTNYTDGVKGGGGGGGGYVTGDFSTAGGDGFCTIFWEE